MVDIAAELQKFRAENADGLAADRAGLVDDEDFADDDTETPAAPAETPKEKLRASLDDVILDDPRLPESLRGKPASALFDDRTEHVRRLNDAGFQKNQAAAERDAAFKLLEQQVIALKDRREPVAPPPPPPNTQDRMRHRGITDARSVMSDPDATLARVVEAGADEAEDRVRPRIEQLEAQIEHLSQDNQVRETRERNATIRAAYMAARPTEITPEAWNEFAPYASTFVVGNKIPADNPESYTRAFVHYRETSARLYGAQTPPPSGEPPAAPAPPVGGGKAAPPKDSSKPSAHLNNRQRSVAARIVKIYEKHGLTKSVDDIVGDLRKDEKTKGMFP